MKEGIKMNIQKVNAAEVKPVKVTEQKQDYGYLWKEDKDIIDANVKYAAERNKKLHDEEVKKFQTQLQDAKESADIFKKMGIEADKDENGKLTISHYNQPSQRVTFADLGVDEEKLMENVKEVKGDANFQRTSLKTIDGVEKVGGTVNLIGTTVKSMKNLKEIGGVAQMNDSLIEDLSSLKSVGAMANLSRTKVTELPALEKVEGNLDLQDSPITSMPNLKKVKGDVNIINTNMKKEDVKAEVGGKVKDKKEPTVPITGNYDYLWDNTDRVEHNKK